MPVSVATRASAPRGATARLPALLLHALAGALLLVLAPGCGVFSALSNPGAAWALNEPAPMSIVVRRAEVAEATAHQIERLLGETAIAPDSKWVEKTTISKEDAQALLKAASEDPIYKNVPVRVVPAEAWLRALSILCSKSGDADSLTAALGDDVAEKYAEIVHQAATLADMRAELAKIEAALDDKKISAGDKAAKEKERDKLKSDIDKAVESFGPKKEAMIALIKSKGSKAPDPLKDKMKLVLVNLRRAVDDAKTANATAILRYPLALPGMSSDIQTAAKRFAADIVEEQIGNRPDLSTLSPDVKLDGTDVKLTLNGIPAEKLGSISPGDLVTGTTTRTKDYAERVLTLLSHTGDTNDLLSFEADLLDAWTGAMGVDASKSADGTKISDVVFAITAPKPGAPAAAGADAAPAEEPAPAPEEHAAAGPRSLGGLALASCKKGKAKKKKGDDKADADAKTADAKGDKGDKGDKSGKKPDKTDAKGGAGKPAAASAQKPPAKPAGAAAAPAKPAAPAAGAAAATPKPAGAPAKPAGAAPAGAAPAGAAPAGGDPNCPISVMRDGHKVCL